MHKNALVRAAKWYAPALVLCNLHALASCPNSSNPLLGEVSPIVVLIVFRRCWVHTNPPQFITRRSMRTCGGVGKGAGGGSNPKSKIIDWVCLYPHPPSDT